MSAYAEIFKKLQPSHDPRHIEGYVRLEYGVLSHLPMTTLRREARIAAECIKEGGAEMAERNAKSYGL